MQVCINCHSIRVSIKSQFIIYQSDHLAILIVDPWMMVNQDTFFDGPTKFWANVGTAVCVRHCDWNAANNAILIGRGSNQLAIFSNDHPAKKSLASWLLLTERSLMGLKCDNAIYTSRGFDDIMVHALLIAWSNTCKTVSCASNL